jgi:hypothetical protein
MITNAKGTPIATPTPTIKTNPESQSVLAGDSCDDILLSFEKPLGRPKMTDQSLLRQAKQA